MDGNEFDRSRTPRVPRQRSASALLVVAGPEAGRRFELIPGSTVVGRRSDLNIVLADLAVSPVHAQLDNHGNSVVLSDTGSSNGTYLNGHRVGQPVLLTPGDLIGIGHVTLQVVPGQEKVRPEARSYELLQGRDICRSLMVVGGLLAITGFGLFMLPILQTLGAETETQPAESTMFGAPLQAIGLAILAIGVALAVGAALAGVGPALAKAVRKRRTRS